MKLKIKKFLPIVQESEIDLSKKMLVFVGKNNAGKTYVSKLIWSIYNIDDIILHKGKINIFTNKNKEKNEWEIDLREISKNIQNVYNKNLQKFLKKIFKSKEIDAVVIFEDKDWQKFRLNAKFENPIYKVELKKDLESFNIKIKLEKKADVNIKGIDDLDFLNIIEENSYNRMNEFIYYVIIKSLLNINTTYLPESRLLLPKFYKNLLISQKQKIKELLDFEIFLKKERLKKSLAFESDIIEDTIIDKMVLELDEEQKNDYIFMIEKIIEGKIKVKKNDEIGFSYFVYDNGDTELTLERSSSMVNQLTLLYLYFKYWYKRKKENFLIIDEPEMNLHPEKKVDLIEFLMFFASKNKLLITTHSNTMAKVIMNYIDLLNLKEINKECYNKLIEEYELKDLDLKSGEIGVYYFNGTTIIPYKEDKESIHFGTFTEVEKRLNEIYWAIDEYKEENE